MPHQPHRDTIRHPGTIEVPGGGTPQIVKDPAILILDSRRIGCGPKLEGELGFELKPLEHEVPQVMPAFKYHITGQGSYILEKRLASCQHLPK
jgi:hypothetical protein